MKIDDLYKEILEGAKELVENDQNIASESMVNMSYGNIIMRNFIRLKIENGLKDISYAFKQLKKDKSTLSKEEALLREKDLNKKYNILIMANRISCSYLNSNILPYSVWKLNENFQTILIDKEEVDPFIEYLRDKSYEKLTIFMSMGQNIKLVKTKIRVAVGTKDLKTISYYIDNSDIVCRKYIKEENSWKQLVG